VFGLLSQILCVLQNLAFSVLAVIIMAFNAILEALATLLAGLIYVLPPFPDLPSMPAVMVTVLGWINWVFPVGTVVLILAWMAGVWLLWQGIAIALRWARVVS
jgi:uncharacterized membrane protein YozB (DUF420 family)